MKCDIMKCKYVGFLDSIQGIMARWDKIENPNLKDSELLEEINIVLDEYIKELGKTES